MPVYLKYRGISIGPFLDGTPYEEYLKWWNPFFKKAKEDKFVAEKQKRVGSVTFDERDLLACKRIVLEFFSQCVVISKDVSPYDKTYIYCLYSMWFDSLPSVRDMNLEDIPEYEWFIGSRNGGLICMRVK